MTFQEWLLSRGYTDAILLAVAEDAWESALEEAKNASAEPPPEEKAVSNPDGFDYIPDQSKPAGWYDKGDKMGTGL